jgi:cytochrome P450
MSEGDLSFEATKKLPLTRAFFKEALRLYPPITFVPRVALEKVEIEGKRLPKGALVMIAPWTLQRHSKYWEDPHAFKPERFLPENEKNLTQGAYIPFEPAPDQPVVPAARLTTRPAEQVMMHVRHRT